MLSFEEIRNNAAINIYIAQADLTLNALGFTEHSFAHVTKVAETAANILSQLGFSERKIELAKIAGYMHDIGNIVNRLEHAQSGAVMAFRILDKLNMPPEDIATVVTAIGNHDEGSGIPVNPVAAALILADKSDVRRSRVRGTDEFNFDIHDRVNFSVISSKLVIEKENKVIRLVMEIDTKYGSVMDYFEIFLERMVLCRKAAERLEMSFKLEINNQQLI
ncbi:MAG: HD domain-containing protein [Clostridia bacterium]|nr:HD domain-containing protein [Clostridia bacterium]